MRRLGIRGRDGSAIAFSNWARPSVINFNISRLAAAVPGSFKPAEQSSEGYAIAAEEEGLKGQQQSELVEKVSYDGDVSPGMASSPLLSSRDEHGSRRAGCIVHLVGRVTRSRWRFWVLLLVLLSVLGGIFTITRSGEDRLQNLHIDETTADEWHPAPNQEEPDEAEEKAKDLESAFILKEVKPLHVLHPAKERSLQLCRTLATGMASDFPTPRFLNWGRAFKNETLAEGGASMATIESTLSYLNSLTSEQQDDFVLIADAEKTWFQLDQKTLLERYHKVNNEANARAKKQLNTTVANSTAIEHRILFGVSKTCTPNEQNELACSAIPNSPLPKDMYGAATDHDAGFFGERTRMLPRYLNAGFIMGSVGDLKRLFRRAVEKYKEGASATGSAQELFGVILGEQERHRIYMAEQSQSKPAQFQFGTPEESMNGPPKPKEKTESEKSRDKSVKYGSDSFEFGIGLDYFSVLSSTTANAQYENEYVVFNEPAKKKDPTDLFGTLECKPANEKRPSLPSDLKKKPLPFHVKDAAAAAAAAAAAKPKKSRETWADVPLITNLCTGKVPVLVHQNNWNDDRVEQQWTHFWSRPRLKQMVEVKKRAGSREAKLDSAVEVLDHNAFKEGVMIKPEFKLADAQPQAQTEGTTPSLPDAGEGLMEEFVKPQSIGAAWVNRGRGSTKWDLLEWWDLCEGQGYEEVLFGNDWI